MNNCINNGAVKQGSVKQFEDLIDIYGWLGNKAVLIPVPWGTKGPKIPDWQLTTLAASKAKESQDELKGAFYGKTNIGVVLGPSSQGLCAIDCDDEAGRAEMLRLNPQLSKTLCTVGARGCQFWLYIEGDIPSSTAVKYTDRFVFNEKTEKNVPAQFGEWRAEGNQSIIYGEHPNGNMYSVTQRFQPIECAFKDIVWPANTRFADAPAAKRNASAKTAAPQEETSAFNEWAKKYTGDLKTLDVYKLLAQHGITVTVEEGNKVCFRCPCENMHTGKNGDKDCSLYRGELKGRCMHESCGLNSFMALIDHLETRRPGCINDACMADFSDELSQEQLDRLYKSGDENFPAAMWEEAYQGPIGRLINAVIPHTEASKEALLVQALVMFGNALGRGPNIAAGGKRTILALEKPRPLISTQPTAGWFLATHRARSCPSIGGTDGIFTSESSTSKDSAPSNAMACGAFMAVLTVYPALAKVLVSNRRIAASSSTIGIRRKLVVFSYSGNNPIRGRI